MKVDPECPEEMREAQRIASEVVPRLMEHVDSVTILISKRRQDGNKGTWRGAFGDGNWYSRFGHAREWVMQCEADATRAEEKDS